MTPEEARAETRRKRDAGDFDRREMSRRADSLEWDVVKLECGHEISVSPMLDALLMRGGKSGIYDCHDCATTWWEEHGGKGR